MALRFIAMARPYVPTFFFYMAQPLWPCVIWYGSALWPYVYLMYLCILVWGWKYLLPLLSPSSCHCLARGWPPDRLSINCRRAYSWVERCSCPDSCSSLPFNWKLIVHFGCFHKIACIYVSYIVNTFYGNVLLIIASSDVEGNRYMDFLRMHCSLLSTKANPWAGKYVPDDQRYIVCFVCDIV